MDIKRYFGHEKLENYKENLFGIEIELENCNNLILENTPLPILPFWYVMEDGSLRNGGAEFVSIPLTKDQIQASITQLLQYFNEHAMEPRASARTGVHVHVNVQWATAQQFLNLILLSNILERGLFILGGDRTDNPFCVPLNNSEFEDTLLEVGSWYYKKMPHRIFDLSNPWSKYLGINAAPLGKYGTVEFRHMQTPLDLYEIEELTTILNKMVEWVKNTNEDTALKELTTLTDTRYALNTFLYQFFPDHLAENMQVRAHAYNVAAKIKSQFITQGH